MIRNVEVEVKAKNPIKEKPEFEKREHRDLIYLNGFNHSSEMFHSQCDNGIKKILVQLLEPVAFGDSLAAKATEVRTGVDESKANKGENSKNNNATSNTEDGGDQQGSYSIFDREDEAVELLIEAFNTIKTNDARQEAQAKKKNKLLGRKALKDLAVEDVSLVLANLQFESYCQKCKELEVSGLTLSCANSPDDLSELGFKIKAKARELLHHIREFRIGGVPLRLIQLPYAIQEKLAKEEEARLQEEERIADEQARALAEANAPPTSATRKTRRKTNIKRKS